MLSALLLLAVPLCTAFSLPRHDDHDHSHQVSGGLPGTWYHSEDHPAYQLFSRAVPGDGTTYPAVGSQTWAAAYPQSSPPIATLPQPWVDALNAAVAAGKIPNIPQTVGPPNTNPVYPTGSNPAGPEICSGTWKCRNPGDIWDAPTGTFGTGFDDGPLPPSDALYDFLQAQNETATHFMIGINIINNPQQFNKAFQTLGHDIAVHTWTHPYMTKLSNLEVLGQLGWSMQLIHNSTGGRLPQFWRPPYGDSDNRVRAIAKYVFGLTTIYWNQDTEDWSLGEPGGTTPPAIATSYNTWVTGPKTPGLIILEHELSNASVAAFIAAYPTIKANGWRMQSVTQLVGGGISYQNSNNSFAPVIPADGVLVGAASAVLPSGTSATNSSVVTSATNTGSSASATSTMGAKNWAVSTRDSSLYCMASTLLCVIISVSLS